MKCPKADLSECCGSTPPEVNIVKGKSRVWVYVLILCVRSRTLLAWRGLSSRLVIKSSSSGFIVLEICVYRRYFGYSLSNCQLEKNSLNISPSWQSHFKQWIARKSPVDTFFMNLQNPIDDALRKVKDFQKLINKNKCEVCKQNQVNIILAPKWCLKLYKMKM